MIRKIPKNIKFIFPFSIVIFFLILPSKLFATEKVQAEVAVFFSPNGGCEEAIIDSIKKAKKSIYIQAYIFTSDPIAKALIAAKHRNIEILIILDKSQLKASGSKLNLLLTEGFNIYVYKPKGIHHNKIIIIDDNIVITGSYNFTKAAEHSNSENLLIISSTELNGQYLNMFKTMLLESILISLHREMCSKKNTRI